MRDETTAKPSLRKPYKLADVVTELRDQLRTLDVQADGTIDAFMDAYDDAHIDEAEFRDLLMRMVSLVKEIKDSRLILTLLDASGSEVALREVEYQQQLRKEGKS